MLEARSSQAGGSSCHLILGTAGHIDHGKTSLVKALTGIDTDRLKEEKERGITIELGFAHFALEGGEVVAVVDVPGHERFVRTMVAGAVGIDAALLVVAADEGVMPQTREHLDICELLGLRGGVIALSKCDLVDAELCELARLELREALRGTFLANAPIIPCSARTGEGLTELRAALSHVLKGLAEQPRCGRDRDGLLRLPLDRVFALRGFGTVATGTLWSGQLCVGDELMPLPGPAGPGSASKAKVRAVQVHGQKVDLAVAGQRTAVNLAAPREAFLRGDTLVRPGSLLPSLLIEVELVYLKVARDRLPRRSRLLFHAVSAQRLCTVTLLDKEELRPGERGLAQLKLDAPLVLLPGDRFVLRGFSPQRNHGTTVGGGMVLRTRCVRKRHGSAALSATLRECQAALLALHEGKGTAAAVERLVSLEVYRQGVHGAGLSALRMMIPVGEKALRAALDTLLAAGGKKKLVPLHEKAAAEDGPEGGDEPLYLSAALLDGVGAKLLKVLAEYHGKDPRAVGMLRETLRSQLAKRGEPLSLRLFQHILEGLFFTGAIIQEKDVLRLQSHKVTSDESRRLLEESLATLYHRAGLAPPRSDELLALLAVSPPPSSDAIRSALDSLLRRGTLVRIKDLLFHCEALLDLQKRLISYLEAHREITAAAWKEIVGQSRKFSIPLAEHFDAVKLTLRVGEVRRLRGR